MKHVSMMFILTACLTHIPPTSPRVFQAYHQISNKKRSEMHHRPVMHWHLWLFRVTGYHWSWLWWITVNFIYNLNTKSSVFINVVVEAISSIPLQLEEDDIEDFCSLAQYYASRTPQSFRKVDSLFYFTCVWMVLCQ